jgi:hypothetical protein
MTYLTGKETQWSRLPFITPVRNGSQSILPLRRIIRGNCILGTYSSQECIDNGAQQSLLAVLLHKRLCGLQG